jgi:hypothetical protein
VNSHLRRLAGVLCGLVLFGATGCSQDNETEIQKLSKDVGSPGAKNPNETKGTVGNDPSSRAERVKNVSDQKKAMQGAGYPKN